MEIKFSQDIQDVINLIQSNGYEAYVVGGYIRDYIVGKSNYDVDITTSATTDVLVNILKKYKLNDSFTRFGNIKFMSGEYTVEITTFRKEYNYIGHRKPGKIEFTNSLDEDLVRRDFTINAICSDGNKIIDMFGGISDLKNKVIKTIGDADIRLEEDSLRILRALRFSSKYGLSIDSKLKESINKNHKYLSEISFFSRYKELKGILEGKGCIRVLKEYKKVLKDAFFLDDLKVCLLTNCSNLEEKVALFFYYSNINISNKYLCCRDLKFKEDKVNLKYKLK